MFFSFVLGASRPWGGVAHVSDFLYFRVEDSGDGLASYTDFHHSGAGFLILGGELAILIRFHCLEQEFLGGEVASSIDFHIFWSRIH